MSNFISLLPPPKTLLSNWVHGVRSTAQPDSSIPQTFRDALAVREDVFIDEQHCSLENEVDEDDHRSYHWVVYASVGTPSPTTTATNSGNNFGNNTSTNDMERKPSGSSVPVGTIRLVPPPHPPHPRPAPPVANNAEAVEASPKYHEPYVKITRLAVSAPFRHLKLGRLLISTALAWVSSHGEEIGPKVEPAVREEVRQKVELREKEGTNDVTAKDGETVITAAVEGLGDAVPVTEGEKEVLEGWRGLVLIHAQKDRKGFWEKMGFEHDPGLGEWDEEGIDHIGMWKWVPVKKHSGKSLSPVA